MRPKSKDSRIIISYFIDERNGYIALTKGEHEIPKEEYPTIIMNARQLLGYEESSDGYNISDKFLSQIKQAIKIV